MELFRILLILLIIMIFSYILYGLLHERAILLKKNASIKEGLTALNPEVAVLARYAPSISIQNMNDNRKNQALREYCIKGSYNSAYTGKNISTDMIQYVLSRGCRFIDLQIHYSEKDNIVYVANITDPKAIQMESTNRLPLDTIFHTIITNAFSNIQSSTGCPNPKDPLFIHLRIIENKHTKIYDKIAGLIKKHFPVHKRFTPPQPNIKGKPLLVNWFNQLNPNNRKQRQRAQKIDGYTRMDQHMMGKTIFLIDKTYNPDWTKNSKRLPEYINGETGGNTFQLHDYNKMQNREKTPPIVQDNFKITNIIHEKIVIPDLPEKTTAPNIIDMVINYGVQVVLYPFYKQSDNLTQSENLFNEYKSSFVPMAYAIQYLGRVKNELDNNRITFGSF